MQFLKPLKLMLATGLAFTVMAGGQCDQGRLMNEHGLRTEMLVATEWLAQHLHDPEVVVLCIANATEFCDQGRIPGARFIPLSAIAITRDGVPNELAPIADLQAVFEAAGVSNGSRVVIYGERHGLFAARAYYTLDYMGVAGHAALLNGGLEKWKAEGRPLNADVPKIARGKLTVKPRQELLVDLSEMQAMVRGGPSSAAILDARPPDEFSGAKISEDVSVAGHIPRASGLYWMRLIESTTNPVLRPEAELRELFSQAGAGKNRKIVTYCRSGMQSSYDYFVARYLGYDPAMYDGSFYEWSRHSLPVVKEGK